MLRSQITERAAYLAVALLVVGLLSLRPIPSTTSANDTGRYLQEFRNQCEAKTLVPFDADLTWATFHLATRPLCAIGQDRAFMFFLALIVPGIFLIFGDWKNLAIVWALAGLLSFAAFEFATNALRQSLGLGVLILGIHFLVRGRYTASLASAAAAITFHVSAIAFGPFLAYIATREFVARAGRLAQLAMATLAVVSLSLLAWIFAEEVNGFFSARRLWYQEGSSPFFLVFVHLPVIITFAIRVVSTRGQVSHLELSFFCYVILLASATLILFPAILYRLALTSALLQLYLASIASNASPKQAGWVLLGLSMHLLSFFMLSEYARGVIGV